MNFNQRVTAQRCFGNTPVAPDFGAAVWLGDAYVGYGQALSLARAAMRRGGWAEAEALLMKAAPLAGGDAAFCNLVGILWEARGDHRRARKFYGDAIRADGRYEPAQQNMRRLYELATFGRTSQPVALGDALGDERRAK